MLPVAYLIEIR